MAAHQISSRKTAKIKLAIRIVITFNIIYVKVVYRESCSIEFDKHSIIFCVNWKLKLWIEMWCDGPRDCTDGLDEDSHSQLVTWQLNSTFSKLVEFTATNIGHTLLITNFNTLHSHLPRRSCDSLIRERLGVQIPATVREFLIFKNFSCQFPFGKK